MSEADLFDVENAALDEARTAFGGPGTDATSHRRALGELIGHYERLMRDTSRLIRHSDRQEREMNQLNHRLQELAQELRFRATHDPLTGALNRGAVIEQATSILATKDLAVILLDIDYFKFVNDSFGHLVGDGVICGVVDCMRQVARDTDIIGRVGGEEFTVLLPGRSGEEAAALAHSIRERIASHDFGAPLTQPVTASFGVSSNRAGSSFRDAYARADEALYVAKRGGRNRVVRADDTLPTACESP
jgi:diguanylate cyclase (GGDEF)-like protein